MTDEGKSKQTTEPSIVEPSATVGGFPIVGIGASAGGLDAFEQFFTNMPPDSEMAFVLVQHLDPTHDSILVDLVRRYTRMPVTQVKDGMTVKANHVYIIPPNRDMALLNGQLHLMEPAQRRGLRLPIDFFFRSLAEDQKDRAICIVLSGTGSDGTLGLKAVKGEGGIALAQEPATAKYDGMPYSALNTGLVDYILPPEQMPEQLIRYARHAFAPDAPSATPLLTQSQDPRHDVFMLLRRQTGHDFSAYKPNTIRRRIERRMAVNQISQTEDYVRLLHEDPGEVETLFRELLIGVTNFFRDPEAFEVLEQEIIPLLFADLQAGQALRVWVPGCSSGEEAYSIAILLAEYMERHHQDLGVHIFATDIDEQAIDKARAGVYPDNIAADVSPERLQRYFVKEGHSYQINKRIRDSVVFAVQSLVKDPPFSKLDLISCRNVLIYLDASLQDKVISLFHYALKPDGYLFLGKSESLGKFTEEFAPTYNKFKIFQRLPGNRPLRALFSSADMGSLDTEARPFGKPGRGISLRETTHKLLLEQYAPPCAIVNESGDILYIYGRMGKYLEPTTGEPNMNMNVLHIARPGLRMPLATALRKAAEKKERVVRPDVAVQINGGRQYINLTVQPLLRPAAMQGLMQVIFEDVPDPIPVETKPKQKVSAQAGVTVDTQEQRIAELEQELRSTREYLQTTTEELETSNEELQSANEELQSSNEELQSTNEELETSKEELQSINEELVTVNNELRNKIDDLTHANEDINNLLNSVAVGVIFLDRRLQIERYNPLAQEVVNLIESDIGRPLQHLVTNLDYDTLQADCQAVLETLEVHETEVCARDDQHWYTLRIQPYCTLDDAVAGLVLTFGDVTTQKQMQAELERLRHEEFRALVENSPDLIVRFDRDLRHLYVNPAVTKVTGISFEDYVGKTNEDLGMPEKDVALWNSAIRQVLDCGEETTIEFNYETVDGVRYFESRLAPEFAPDGSVATVLGVIRDLTERKGIEDQLKKTNEQKTEILESINDGFFALDDELTVTYFNRAAERLLGRDGSEIVGQQLFDAFPLARGSVFEEKYRYAIREKQVLNFEAYYDEYQDWYAVNVYPQENGISVYFQVVTERKRVEQELQRYAAELARSNQELEQFARIVSHDLQEPLRMVRSFLGLLKSDYEGQLDDEADEYIRFAVEGAEHMSDLIKALLDYALVGSRGQDPAPTDAEEVLERVLQTLQFQIEQESAAVTHDPLPTVLADATQLQQVLQNLIGNALKFRREEPPHVHVSAERQGETWVLMVQDNGIGIDPQDQDSLFEPFRRLHPRHEYPGSGMGLAICAKIIARHGGHMWVESTPDQGATFSFSLPDGQAKGA